MLKRVYRLLVAIAALPFMVSAAQTSPHEFFQGNWSKPRSPSWIYINPVSGEEVERTMRDISG